MSNKIIQKRRFPFKSIISLQAAHPWSCWGGSGAGSGRGGGAEPLGPPPGFLLRSSHPFSGCLSPPPPAYWSLPGSERQDSWRTGPVHLPFWLTLRLKSPSRGATPDELLYLEWHPPSQPAGFCVPPLRLPPVHPAQLSRPLPATSPSVSHYIVI